MIDLRIKHYFSPGVYAKEMHLPAQHVATSHKHEYDHISHLSAGRVLVCVDGVEAEYAAPAFIMIRAHAEHEIVAIEDAVWFCIHQTDETDASKIDEVLIEKAA
ncbi:MAG: cupin domain-containing protein [Pseudomonadota bacterium]